MWRTSNTGGLDAVMIVSNGNGGADVWIRTNIETVEDDDGTRYEADETHGLFSPAPTAAEIEADLATWIAACEAQNKTDAERMAELMELSELHEAAILELAELMGGE